MRFALVAVSCLAGLTAPAASFAQDVIIERPAEREIIVREPAEREVIVREPEVREVVRPSATVRRYVVEESRPSISYEGSLTVGETLPEAVDVYDVPESDFRYTIVNNRRYILDDDRRVLEVVD